jgi:hypothetical protein
MPATDGQMTVSHTFGASQISAQPGSPRIPSYRLHKSTNRAVVTLHGREIFLGRASSRPRLRGCSRLSGPTSSPSSNPSTPVATTTP